MKAQQEKFYNFIMERVTDKDKAKELLAESFKKQEEGSFNKEYMMTFIPKMLQIIKPEFIDEVKEIMANHKSKL